MPAGIEPLNVVGSLAAIAAIGSLANTWRFPFDSHCGELMSTAAPVLDISAVAKRTRDALERRTAVLFLGAGASMEGTGPSGRELTEKLVADFPDVSHVTTDFLDICQDILDTPRMI